MKSIPTPFKLLISAAAVCVYALFFGVLRAQFGPECTALSWFVVVLIAWFYGPLRGFISSILIIFLNILLLSSTGGFSWAQMGHADASIGAIILLVSGVIVGRVSKMQIEIVIHLHNNQKLSKQLNAEQNLLQNLLDHILDHIFFKDTEARFIRINHAEAKMLGIQDPQKAVGKTDFDFFPESFARAVFQDDQQVIQTGQPIVHHLEHLIDEDGHETWLSATKAPTVDANGEITGLVGISRDITEQKNANEALRINEERYRSIYDHSPLAFVLWNDTFQVIDWNKRAEEIFGWSREEVLGHNVFEFLIPLWEKESLLEKVNQLFSEKQEGLLINQNLTKNGRVIMCEWHNSPLHGPDGKAMGAISLALDITERIHIESMEKEQRILAEALRDTAAALTSTLSLDEVFDRVLSNVGKVVSHDGVNIMLIEGTHARVVRARGYTEKEFNGYLESVNFSISDIPNFNLMMKTGKPIFIADTHLDANWAKPSEIPWLRSYAGAPIKIRGKTIGFLNLDSSKAGFFTPELADRLQAFADQAAVAIENAQLYDQIQALASQDSLTGLLNRRGLSEFGQKEMNRAIRLNHPLSAIMLDIDHYKNINDGYGHFSGDQVLCEFAKLVKSSLRDIDIIGRYGGDEFVILAIESDIKGACEMAERLRAAVEKIAIPFEGEIIHFTISMGISEINPCTRTIHELISQADSALYQAKGAGRNCVRIFNPNE
jgi:diguanylate cyclase (GGDEF)-like protein/PAS domain S-box-containing protein